MPQPESLFLSLDIPFDLWLSHSWDRIEQQHAIVPLENIESLPNMWLTTSFSSPPVALADAWPSNIRVFSASPCHKPIVSHTTGQPVTTVWQADGGQSRLVCDLDCQFLQLLVGDLVNS